MDLENIMATHERVDLALRVVEGELACCGFLSSVILITGARLGGFVDAFWARAGDRFRKPELV